MMTRKHFEKLAYALAMSKTLQKDLSSWNGTVNIMITMCKSENPNFNEATFRKACNPEYWVNKVAPF